MKILYYLLNRFATSGGESLSFERYSLLSWISKMYLSAQIAFTISIPTWCLAKFVDWTISNQDYVASVLACIAIDHIVGSFYHALKLRDFTMRKNAVGLIRKLSLCALSIILFELIHYAVKDVTFIYDYLKITTRLIIILYPATSAFVNMSAITKGRFPPIGWVNKLNEFNNTSDITKLK